MCMAERKVFMHINFGRQAMLSAAILAMVPVVSGGEDPAHWVDPFVGTSATGHTSPAACVPLGLVQAGPDTVRRGRERRFLKHVPQGDRARFARMVCGQA